MSKKYLLLALAIPVALIWDIFYGILTFTYDVCTKIDRKGEVLLDKIQSL